MGAGIISFFVAAVLFTGVSHASPSRVCSCNSTETEGACKHTCMRCVGSRRHVGCVRTALQAWCLLLADWGYGGHCYEASELEVLEADLDSLRQYAADNEVSLGVSRLDSQALPSSFVCPHSCIAT